MYAFMLNITTVSRNAQMFSISTILHMYDFLLKCTNVSYLTYVFGQKGLSEQCRHRSNLIRVYTISHSVIIF